MKILDMHASISDVDSLEVYAHMKRGPDSGDPAECTVDATLRRMDQNQMESSVVWRIGRSAEECSRNNTWVAEMAAKHADRFIPFATAYVPDPDTAIKEIDRAILELGMAGVKIHPNVMDFKLNSAGAKAVVAHVASLDVPFVTHVSHTLSRDLPTKDHQPGELYEGYDNNPNSNPYFLEEVASLYESPRFQAAHMGGIIFDWMKDSTITFQTTGATVDVIQWALDHLGPNRIVFGSDFPFYLVEDEVKKVHDLDASDEVKAQILSGNALAHVLK